MKNIQPDSVLLTRAEYERLSKCAKTDNFNQTDIVDLVKRLPPVGNREVYTLKQLKYDLTHSNEKVQV